MKYAFYPGCSYSSAAGYKESVDAVIRVLGIRFDEIPDWNCCGATVYPGVSEKDTMLLGARVFSLANKNGYLEIITGCNACYSTLRKVLEKLKADKAFVEDVNRRLSVEGLVFDDNSKIRHVIEVFANDVPEALWTEKITSGHKGTRPCFNKIKVAPYYGCQLTRPWNDLDPADMLERLIEKVGFTTVDHSAKTMCCGASLAVPHAKETRPLIKRIIDGAVYNKADIVTTLCPLCQFNLDQGQAATGTAIPVTYFSQIIGLALGLEPEELGLDKLLIRVKKDVLHGRNN